METKKNHIIEINIKNYEQITSTYNDNSLNEALATYIYRECQGIPLKNKINLQITTEFEMSEEEKRTVSDLIHAYFGLEVKEILILDKTNIIRDFILFISGLIILAIAFFIQTKNFNVIPEILIIIGWILLWEVLYYFLFDNKNLRIKIKRYKKLSECKIKFENKKSN